RTVNDLHVPVNKPVKFVMTSEDVLHDFFVPVMRVINKPVKFVMTSEDVLHDFFVPVMRVKHDVIPGRYTQVWFTPNVEGVFEITCAEYCGKGHSDMRAKLT